MIPDYFYGVAVENSISDAQLERYYNEFQSYKFHHLKKRKHKEFFLSVIIQLNVGTAIKMCEFLMSKLRIPRSPNIDLYKHEFVLHYINSIQDDRADFLLLWSLINVVDDINKIRFLSNYLSRKELKEIKYEKPIRFI